MLANYDAQAVADIMGIAFVEDHETSLNPRDMPSKPVIVPSGPSARRLARDVTCDTRTGVSTRQSVSAHVVIDSGKHRPFGEAMADARRDIARGPRARSDINDRMPAGRFAINVAHRHIWIVDLKSAPRIARVRDPNSGDRMHTAVHDVARRPASPDLIEKAVECGLPRVALRHVAEHIAGADTAKISALEWTIVPKTTLERRSERLSPVESERTERVARLFVHARRVLGSDGEARDFMTARHPLLDERTPIDAAKTDLGTRRTEQILNALEYGLAL